MTSTVGSRKPTNLALTVHWLRAQRAEDPFYSTKLSGWWCLSVSLAEVDDAWARIEQLVHEGKIRAASVTTAWSLKEQGLATPVIRVFNDDWTNNAEVTRVRKLLFEAGFHTALGYQRSIDARKLFSAEGGYLYSDADMGLACLEEAL